ncbi:MAG: hypothetical protein JO119_07455 [Acidobacteria bacterium]|nr:hypothetical protein [Acidobacteriota bacterium]
MRSQPRLTAALLVVSLLFSSAPSSASDATEVETLGVVVTSHSATLGNGIASDGATLFNGDRLVTAPNGGLTLRSGGAMLYMSGSTQVTLHRTPSHNPAITKSLIRANVTSGSVSFSLTPDQYFLVSANGALIGPAAPMPTVGEITILDRKLFEIRARRGPLKIVYFDDSEIIPEGKSYRVELADPDTTPTKNSTTAVTSIKTRPRPSGRRHFILLFLLGLAAVAATGGAFGYTRSVESPDCPQPNQCSRPH